MRNFFKAFDDLDNLFESINKDLKPWNLGLDETKETKDSKVTKEETPDTDYDVYEFKMSNVNGDKDFYFRHNDMVQSFKNFDDCLSLAKKEMYGEKQLEEKTTEETPELTEEPQSNGVVTKVDDIVTGNDEGVCTDAVIDDEDVDEHEPCHEESCPFYDESCPDNCSYDEQYDEGKCDEDCEEAEVEECEGTAEDKVDEKRMPYYMSDIYVTFADEMFPDVDEIISAHMFSEDDATYLSLVIEPHDACLYQDRLRAGAKYAKSPIFINYSSDFDRKTRGASMPLALGFKVIESHWINQIVNDELRGKGRNNKDNVLVPFRFRVKLRLED